MPINKDVFLGDDSDEPTHLRLPMLPATPQASGAPGQGPLRLVVVNETLLNTHLLPESGTLVIGRGPEAQIYVPHPSVSRRHAALHLGPPLTLEDLASA